MFGAEILVSMVARLTKKIERSITIESRNANIILPMQRVLYGDNILYLL